MVISRFTALFYLPAVCVASLFRAPVPDGRQLHRRYAGSPRPKHGTKDCRHHQWLSQRNNVSRCPAKGKKKREKKGSWPSPAAVEFYYSVGCVACLCFLFTYDIIVVSWAPWYKQNKKITFDKRPVVHYQYFISLRCRRPSDVIGGGFVRHVSSMANNRHLCRELLCSYTILPHTST